MTVNMSKRPAHWLVFLLLAIGVAGAIWWTAAERKQAKPADSSSPSTEWTVAPDGPQVEVKLPETPMHNVPSDQPSSAGRREPAQQ